MQTPPSQLATLDAQANDALRAGKEREALALWSRILSADPNHIATLVNIGKHSQRKGDMKSALAAFERVAAIDGKNAQHWLNIALVHHNLKNFDAERQAVQRALLADPLDLLALIMHAELLKRGGGKHEVAAAYDAIVKVAPPPEQLHPNLRPALENAIEQKRRYDNEYGVFLDDYLAPLYRELGTQKLGRFRDSLDIMVGRKRRYESQSMIYHYPGLAPIAFFDRGDFPWLDELEAATEGIRDEFLRVLESQAQFTPYIKYDEHLPVNQFAELNNSLRWSAFHLYESGKVIEENAARCPLTMSLLQKVPRPDMPGRTPAAMFSMLKPNTRIPAHVGVTNARLVVHLPLIVPEKCGFRVGNDTREWVPGKAWVFDDTIDHEAWNDSDEFRVVLIFDIWHPQLSAAERQLITQLMQGANIFTEQNAPFDL
jgi:aspartate beta-hydroxylase